MLKEEEEEEKGSRRRSARKSNIEEKEGLEKENKSSKKGNLKSNSNGSKCRKQKGKPKVKALEELTSSLAQGVQPMETRSPRKSGQKVSSQRMPEKHVLEFVLDLLQRKDRFNLFADPVKPGEVEAYYEIVKKPMDFSTIRTKLHDGMYTNLDQFENDIYLICRNTRNFTPSNTLHNREVGQFSPSNLQATHLCEYARKVFQTLRTDLDTFKLAFSLNKRRSEIENPSHPNKSVHNSSNFLQGSDNKKDSNSSATERDNSSDYPQKKGKELINADDIALKSLDHNNERSEYKESLLRSAKEAGEAAAAAYGWKLQPASLPVFSKQVQAGMTGDKHVGNMDMRNDLINGKAINFTSDYAPLTLHDRMNTTQGSTQENEPIFSDLVAATLKWNTGNWMSHQIYRPKYTEMKNSPESDTMIWPTQVISDHTQSRLQPEMNATSDLAWSSSLFPSLIAQQKAVPDNSLPPLPPHLQIVQVTQEVPDNGLPPFPSQLQIFQVEDPTWLPPLSQGQSSLPAGMERLFQVQSPVNQNMGFMNRVGDGHYSSAMRCEFNCAFHTAQASKVAVPWIQTPEYRGTSFCMPVEIDIWGRNKQPPQQEIEMALSCDMGLVNETGSSGLDNQGLEALLPTANGNKNPNLSLQL